jgi:hypothetical protein
VIASLCSPDEIPLVHDRPTFPRGGSALRMVCRAKAARWFPTHAHLRRFV